MARGRTATNPAGPGPRGSDRLDDGGDLIYRFDLPDRFELLCEGDFRAQAGYLVLQQPLGGLAAATVFFVADLARVVSALGNRGYRVAQLEAGIRAGPVQATAPSPRARESGLPFATANLAPVCIIAR